MVRCQLAERNQFEVEQGVHRFDSLVILLSGSFQYGAENQKRTVLPFQPVVFKRGTAFQKKVISPIEFIIVSDLQFSFDTDHWLEYEQEDLPRLQSSIRLLKNALLQAAPDEVIEHYVYDILLTARPAPAEKTPPEAPPAYIELCRNFQQNYSLQQLAKMSHCSVQTLIHHFKRYCGKTPTQCLTDLRMKHAQELLVNSALSISQIAEACGYENVYYFSTVFKKEFGISPLKYRQSVRV